MKTIALTEDGDFLYDAQKGDFIIVEEHDEVAQCIEISFGTNLTEWFLDESEGAEKSKFLGKSTDAEARSEAIRLLSQEERIESIESVTVETDRAARKRTIKYVVQLVDGATLAREVNV